MRIYDLTKAARQEDDICADYEQKACHENVQCHLSCWLQNPTSGICPFMSGGKYDQR